MFIRILKYSLKNILRNKFLSFSSILVLTLLMFFINILLVLHNVSLKLIDSVNNKLSISLYLEEKYDKNSNDVVSLMNSIKEVNKNILVIYKSKEDALALLKKKDPKLVQILEKTNPLPATIELSNINISDYSKINEKIEGKSFLFGTLETTEEWGWLYFSDYKSQYTKITKVINVLNTLQISLYIIIWVFIFSIWIIIYSIIWNFVYYFKDEIYITRLVWWSKFFIYWPFGLQWLIYSSLSFFISLILFYFTLKNTSFILWNEYSFSFVIWSYFIIFIIEFLIFWLVWGISGLISSKKYLK